MPESQFKRYNEGQECPSLAELKEFVESAAAADEDQCTRLDEHLERCAHCRHEFEIAAGSVHRQARLVMVRGAERAAKTRPAPEYEVQPDSTPAPPPIIRALAKAKKAASFALSPKFVAGVLVVLLPLTAYAIYNWPDQAAWESFLCLFARSEKPSVTVIGNNPVDLPDKHERVTDKVGVFDAVALGAWQTALWKFGESSGRVLTSEQVKELLVGGRSPLDGPLVIIGGPSSSELSLEYMARLRDVSNPRDLQGLQRGFRFEVAGHGPATAFTRPAKPELDGQAPELGIRDVETEDLVRVFRTEKNTFDPDAALVMLGNLDGRPVLIVAGFESRGTGAAMRWLLRPSPELTKFYRIYRDQGYAEAVLVTRSGSDEPELFRFSRGVQNPRGK